VIEPSIAAQAARCAQRDERAEQLLEQMDAITDLDDQAQRGLWSEADRALHRRLAAMTGNQIVEQMADYVHRVMDQPLWRRLRDEAARKPHRLRVYAAEHRLIYDAIVNGRVEQAHAHAAEHVKRVRRDMTLD
jgi:DNA-binding FadR family transcriptional regulator